MGFPLLLRFTSLTSLVTTSPSAPSLLFFTFYLLTPATKPAHALVRIPVQIKKLQLSLTFGRLALKG